MATQTQNLNLTQWSLISDFFNHTQLSDNWNTLDIHDHTPGHGVQIPTDGLANASVSTNKLQDGSVTPAKLAPGSLGTTQIADLSVTTGKLSLASVGTAQLQNNSVTSAILANHVVGVTQLAAVPRVRAYSHNVQNVLNDTVYVVQFELEYFDTDNMHSQTSNQQRLVINTPGAYSFSGGFEWQWNNSGHREANLRRNGSDWLAGITTYPPPSGTWPARSYISAGPFYMNAGDYVELLAFQSSGTSLTINNTVGGYFLDPTFQAVFQSY